MVSKCHGFSRGLNPATGIRPRKATALTSFRNRSPLGDAGALIDSLQLLHEFQSRSLKILNRSALHLPHDELLNATKQNLAESARRGPLGYR